MKYGIVKYGIAKYGKYTISARGFIRVYPKCRYNGLISQSVVAKGQHKFRLSSNHISLQNIVIKVNGQINRARLNGIIAERVELHETLS